MAGFKITTYEINKRVIQHKSTFYEITCYVNTHRKLITNQNAKLNIHFSSAFRKFVFPKYSLQKNCYFFKAFFKKKESFVMIQRKNLTHF